MTAGGGLVVMGASVGGSVGTAKALKCPRGCGRRSRLDPPCRSTRRRVRTAMTDAATNPLKAGLEDVVVSPSEICFIDGHKGRLIYRGYDVDDLGAHSTFA